MGEVFQARRVHAPFVTFDLEQTPQDYPDYGVQDEGCDHLVCRIFFTHKVSATYEDRDK